MVSSFNSKMWRVASLPLMAAAVWIPLASPPARAQTAADCSLRTTIGAPGGTENGSVDVWTKTDEGTPAELERPYRVYVPDGITEPNAPLIMALHPFSVGPGLPEADLERLSGLNAAADRGKFIVVYPWGSWPVWHTNDDPDPNPYIKWEYRPRADNYDADFILQVLDEVKAAYCIDSSRVYLHGMSLGGTMAMRMACEHSDVFAAVHTHASADPEFQAPPSMLSQVVTPEPCSVGVDPTKRKIPIFMSFGWLDPTRNRPSEPSGDGVRTRQKWVSRYQCSDTITSSTPGVGPMTTYSGCTDPYTAVHWQIVNGTSHLYPTGDQLVQLNDRVLYFFTLNSLP